MKRTLGIAGAFLALAFMLTQTPTQAAPPKMTFRANLTGAEEVPPRVTNARGHATFVLNKAGTELTYRLVVTNILNVTEAHIHLGAVGQNGLPVVILYGPVAPGGGKKNGMLSTGVITAASLTGPLAGKTLTDLLEAIRSGDTYVNVHTNDGTGDANRGAGDFPDGEIRGQVK